MYISDKDKRVYYILILFSIKLIEKNFNLEEYHQIADTISWAVIYWQPFLINISFEVYWRKGVE